MSTISFHQKALVYRSDKKYLALKATYKGLLWDLPGGFVDIPEESEPAIRREVLEETGLAISDLRVIAAGSLYQKEADVYHILLAIHAKQQVTK